MDNSVQQLKLNVTNIRSVLVNSNKELIKISSAKSALIRKEDQINKRKLAEKNIETTRGGSSKGKNIFSAVTAPVGSFFDKVLNFAGTVLVGAIINNLPAIIEKAQEFIGIVKPLWDGAVSIITSIFNGAKNIFESISTFFFPKKIESDLNETTADLNSLQSELDFDENILDKLGPLPSEEELDQEQLDDSLSNVPETAKELLPTPTRIPVEPYKPQKRNEGGEITKTTQPNQPPPKSSPNAKHPFERLYNNVHMNKDTLALYKKNIEKYDELVAKMGGIKLDSGGGFTGGGPPSSPDQTPVPVNVGPITPGGMLDFIGHGDGATGKLVLKDASGKKVGSWEAISGVFRTAGTSQADRTNVSGRLYPLPDGTYPLVAYARHGYVAGVGTWSTFINNASGSIGRRSAVMVHNDIGSNGTAGCIGVELGGRSGTKAEQAFLTLYEAVKPTSVKVSIGKGAKKNESLNAKPRVTPDNVPVAKDSGEGKINTVVIPVEVDKPVVVNKSSTTRSRYSSRRGTTSNSINNIP